MIRAGIVGGAGYTAGELIRILVFHPSVELVFVHSESNAGNLLTEVHEGLTGDTALRFSDTYDLSSIDVLFLCSAHGKSREFWQHNTRPPHLKVIDLAQDFRDQSEGYVYGLPEWQAERIQNASLIANPGCFATAIQLALLPLAFGGYLKSEIHINAITGSTGAGVKSCATTHFSWRNSNISTYKVFEHQHLLEISRNLSQIQGEGIPDINFVPVRGDFARGIFATLYTDCPLSESELRQLYHNFYDSKTFIHVLDCEVDLKQVVNTNKCILNASLHKGKAVITSVIDNLLKGAAGQAVQNMNLIFHLSQNEGLKLKASAF